MFFILVTTSSMDPGAAKEPVCLGVVGAAKKLKDINKSVAWKVWRK